MIVIKKSITTTSSSINSAASLMPHWPRWLERVVRLMLVLVFVCVAKVKKRHVCSEVVRG